MQKEYDFSKGERGKFFRTDAKFNLPIYLEDEVMSFIKEVAQKKGQDLSTTVNQLLRSDMHFADILK